MNGSLRYEGVVDGMATAVRGKHRYATYGNVAYDTAYAPQIEREGRAEPLVRPRERVVGRQRVKVRQAGYVAPVSVLGFALVAVMAVLVLMSYVQAAQRSNEIVHLRREASTLSEEHAKLMAEYELAFDLKSVEEQVTANGSMVHPQPGQVVTLDLSEPDSAKVFQREDQNLLRQLWEGLAGAVENTVAFFR